MVKELEEYKTLVERDFELLSKRNFGRAECLSLSRDTSLYYGDLVQAGYAGQAEHMKLISEFWAIQHNRLALTDGSEDYWPSFFNGLFTRQEILLVEEADARRLHPPHYI